MKIGRKKLFAFGVVLCVSGVLVSLLYMYPVRRYYIDPHYYNSLYQYEVSGYFDAGDMLFLDLSLTPFKNNPKPLPFNVSIFDSTGNIIVFRVEFVSPDLMLPIYEYTILRDEGFLFFEEGILGGYVKHSGNYTVVLDRLARESYGDPPSVLNLIRGVKVPYTEYPYRIHLPAPYRNIFPYDFLSPLFGSFLLVLGGVLAFRAFKSKKPPYKGRSVVSKKKV